jgi:cysteine desulfurase
MKKVYLDYNATTPVLPDVLEVMMPFFCEKFGNPSSIHGLGHEAADALNVAAERVAALIGAKAEDIVFTSGGTESNNLAIAGSAYAGRKNGRKRIITTRVEHSSSYETCLALEKEGFKIKYLEVDREGLIDPEVLRGELSDDVALVSLLLVNNETGTVQDYESIRKVMEHSKVTLHYDAVQAAGKMPLDVIELGASLLSISSHKIYGPKGAGALYVRSGTPLEPVTFGGGQEKGLRPGTQNVSGVVGLGTACMILRDKLKMYMAHCKLLRDRLENGIIDTYPAAVVNGCRERRICNTTNVSFPGFFAKKLSEELDERGIAVSTGAACSAGKDEVSRVLEAMKVPPLELFGALRFSVGEFTDQDDIEYVIEQLSELIRKNGNVPSGSEIISL